MEQFGGLCSSGSSQCFWGRMKLVTLQQGHCKMRRGGLSFPDSSFGKMETDIEMCTGRLVHVSFTHTSIVMGKAFEKFCDYTQALIHLLLYILKLAFLFIRRLNFVFTPLITTVVITEVAVDGNEV
ncbi:hypothetical protein NC653_034009 [Populus alba x Populus x berolinensis]|uniref:Uncharacterized protein n=1 Tax=Populus alba x Populus x berolinensis TaxID=444605 RepID=A0AAD6LVE2_9ROSI|nr:hypothetical protein NC653_034009 [Populus alba x Populus x berolinensis]